MISWIISQFLLGNLRLDFSHNHHAKTASMELYPLKKNPGEGHGSGGGETCFLGNAITLPSPSSVPSLRGITDFNGLKARGAGGEVGCPYSPTTWVRVRWMGARPCALSSGVGMEASSGLSDRQKSSAPLFCQSRARTTFVSAPPRSTDEQEGHVPAA